MTDSMDDKYLRDAVHTWIRDYASLTIKMTITPDQVESLIQQVRKAMENMNETNKPAAGWECPRCGSVNAPQIEKCKCVKTESTEKDTRQLLTE